MEIKTKYNVNDRVYFWDGIMSKHGNVEEITIKVIQGKETKVVKRGERLLKRYKTNYSDWL